MNKNVIRFISNAPVLAAIVTYLANSSIARVLPNNKICHHTTPLLSQIRLTYFVLVKGEWHSLSWSAKDLKCTSVPFNALKVMLYNQEVEFEKYFIVRANTSNIIELPKAYANVGTFSAIKVRMRLQVGALLTCYSIWH